MSFSRLVKRNKEKQEIENIKRTYGKKAKVKCPKCNKKTLFYTNKEKEIYCMRCEEKVG